MQEPLADMLVIIMPTRESLRALIASGVMAKEWRLLRILAERYRALAIVTPDTGTIEDLRSCIGDDPLLATTQVISAPRGDCDQGHAGELAARLVAAARDARSVVLKTVELCCSEIALAAKERLHAAGKQAALIARGGHLWSQFVAFEHGPHSREAARAGDLEGRLCQAADIVIGTTHGMVKDLAWRYHLDPARCVTITKFVLCDIPPCEAQDRNSKLLLTSGRLIRRKRIELLIEAVAALPEELRSQVSLEILGDGPERPALEALAASLKAPVQFRGFVSNSEALSRMRACAVYLQASSLEGQPASVLEAMAMGAPVLVANAPGLHEIVVHGQSGLRLDPTSESFAIAIQEALGDPDWRDVLGSTASRTVRATAGLSHVAELELGAHALAVAHASSARRAA